MRYFSFLLCFFAGVVNASPIFISERDQFLNLFPDSTLENFESLNVPEFSNITIPETLSSTTNTSEVNPGDVKSGISYTNPDGEIRILGHNDVSYFTELSPVASNRLSFENDDGEELVLTFESEVSAFGLDIIGIEDPQLNISFIATSGERFSQDILAVFQQNTFFGWDFQDSKISSIVIDSVNDYYFAIDDVLFSNAETTDIPEPSVVYLIVIGLFGVSLLRMKQLRLIP